MFFFDVGEFTLKRGEDEIYFYWSGKIEVIRLNEIDEIERD